MNGCLLATSYWKSPCDDIGGAAKTTCSQAKPPKVFEQSNLRLQSHPRFLWEWNDVDQVFKNLQGDVGNLEIEKWYEGGDTLPATRSSHYLVVLPSLRIGPKFVRNLVSEDESYVDIQSIDLCDLCIQLVLVDWHG